MSDSEPVCVSLNSNNYLVVQPYAHGDNPVFNNNNMSALISQVIPHCLPAVLSSEAA